MEKKVTGYHKTRREKAFSKVLRKKLLVFLVFPSWHNLLRTTSLTLEEAVNWKPAVLHFHSTIGVYMCACACTFVNKLDKSNPSTQLH